MLAAAAIGTTVVDGILVPTHAERLVLFHDFAEQRQFQQIGNVARILIAHDVLHTDCYPRELCGSSSTDCPRTSVRLQYDRRRGVMLPYCREPEVDFNRGRRSPHYRFQLRIPFARVRAREVLL
jgi:hypothetical protein